MFHFRAKKNPSVQSYDYNPEKERAVIRASICTGEQVAGFKNKATGEFHEIMLIRNQSELEAFTKAFGLDRVDTEY